MPEAKAQEAPKPDYSSLEGLKLHPLWSLLTRKQALFLEAYISNGGDRFQAVRDSYGQKGNLDVTAMRLLRNGYVRKLVAIHYGYSQDLGPIGKKELTDLVAARLRKENLQDTVFTRLVEYILILRGWKKFGRHEGGQQIVNQESLEERLRDRDLVGAEEIDALVKQIEAGKKK